MRTVFLDREGVINRAFIRGGRPYAPASPQELEVLPGVRDALTRLGAAGYALVVVTNQPDIARRRMRIERQPGNLSSAGERHSEGWRTGQLRHSALDVVTAASD